MTDKLTSGLNYKHTTIVNYASSVVNKLEAMLTDDAKVIIYNHRVFIVQATKLFFAFSPLLVLVAQFNPNI